ncbi:MAG TPA: FAD-dependent oxidoreductase [Dermatophilaceae bacterium]|nr:FAD-dependent oxidoreductase [Dermatophilaceae bacterium]
MSPLRVAVLGAGVMGSSLAIFLARRGVEVVLVDRADEPVSGSSRWNEGKIHLGYLYGADPTLATARHVLPGGLQFARLMSELVGSDLVPHATRSDDTYLVHRRSVVDAAALRSHFEAVTDLAREHPDARAYLVDLSRARTDEIPPHELHTLAGDEVVAGFRVPERSVDTRWVADQLAAAVSAEPGIDLRMATTVHRVSPLASIHGPWQVQGDPGLDESFDLVVNALWDGRLMVDATAGLVPQGDWTHRYRLCVFVRTHRAVDLRSAVVAVGPFGDVKNFGDRDFYLSWYPVGLVAQGEEVAPPEPPQLDADAELAFVHEVRRGLEPLLPAVGRVFDEAEKTLVRGGHVFARGTGFIGDRRSALHRRDRYGVERRGSYLSIDTGKYSTAPWLAERLARTLTDS